MSLPYILGAVRRRGIVVPAGLIILLNDTEVPSNWTRFSAADDKHIVGAGTTYNVGDVGGSKTLSSISLSSGGSHSPGGNLDFDSYAGHTSVDSGGSHLHTVDTDYEPNWQEVLLIKANADISGIALPADTVVLAVSAVSGLSNVFMNNCLLKSDSAISSGGDGTSVTVATSTNGTHNHGTISGRPVGGVGSYRDDDDADHGSHSHSGQTLSITPNVKRKLLSAWTKVSTFDLASGMIALWESATPPDGWAICDGANSTPDLRDYFIEMVASGNEDVTGIGDNTIDYSMSITDNASHTHVFNLRDEGPENGKHATDSWSHSHSASGAQNYTAPYYAFYFIQYAR